MKTSKKILAFFLILLPIVIGGWLAFSSLPLDLLFAHRQLQAAVAAGSGSEELDALEQVLVFTPWRGDLWERVGRLRLTQNDFPGAAAAFSSAGQLEMLSDQGKVWWADALISSGDEENGRLVLTELESTDAVILRQAAALLLRLQDIPSALSNLEKVLLLMPDDPELNYQVGVLTAGSDPVGALQYLEKAKDSEFVGELAKILSDTITKSLDLDEESVRLFQVGQVLAGLDEWEAAAGAFQNAVNVEPGNAEYWALLGEAQQQLGGDGYAALQKAWQIAPDNENVNGLLGIYYRRQGKLDLAEHYLAAALEINPDSINWEVEMGNLLADEGDLEAALAHYQSAVRKDQHNWSSWRELAVFCVKHNFRVADIAIPAVREALLLNPSSPTLLDLMGTAYMMINELDNAERFFLQAEALDPGQAAILIHLGQLALYQEKREKAFEYFRQAARSAQDERLRDMANRLLRENGGKE